MSTMAAVAALGLPPRLHLRLGELSSPATRGAKARGPPQFRGASEGNTSGVPPGAFLASANPSLASTCAGCVLGAVPVSATASPTLPWSAGTGFRNKAWSHVPAVRTRLATRASQDEDQFIDKDSAEDSDHEQRFDEDWRNAEREASEELRSARGAPQALGLSGSELLPSDDKAQSQAKDKKQHQNNNSSEGVPSSPPPLDSTSGTPQRGAAQSVQWTEGGASAEDAPKDGTPGAAAGPQPGTKNEVDGSGVQQAGQEPDPVVRAYQERGVQTQKQGAGEGQANGSDAGVPQAYQEDEARRPTEAPSRALLRTSAGSGIGATPGVRRTVWGQADLEARFSPLRENVSADVVVVGAGINGLSLAHELQSNGMDVIVLEARVVGAGQTGKTTAHLMPWNDDYYSILESLYGRRVSAAVGESHRCAIAKVGRVVQEEGIDCDFRTVDGYLFPHQDTRSTLNTLLQEYEASKRAGFSDVALVDLKGDPRMGSLGTALKFPNAADFHPLKYLKGLAQAFVRKGGRLYENTRVTSDQPDRVRTNTGHTVSARHVVLASNSPINHNLLVHARQHADRSYVVGLRVPPGEIPPAQWWDTASPYHYVRTVLEGEHPSHGDILLVGGEDHPAGALSPVAYPAAYLRLENWARERWPMAQEVVYKWTGQVYKPIDFLGLYGREPSATCGPQFTISTGNSGQGMTGGTISAMVIADQILGRSNPWRHAYSPQRLPPASGQVLQSAALVVQDTVQGYLEDLPFVGDDWASVRKLNNGSGAVVTRGLAKVAAYKDKDGEVHQYSAVCPHLKCAVKWNPIDETFDCPCHGSQFDTKGRCIQGPAKADLPPA